MPKSLYRAKAEVTVYFYRDDDEPSLEEDAAKWSAPAGAMARIKFTEILPIENDERVPNNDLNLEIQANDRDGDPETVSEFLAANRARMIAMQGGQS